MHYTTCDNWNVSWSWCFGREIKISSHRSTAFGVLEVPHTFSIKYPLPSSCSSDDGSYSPNVSIVTPFVRTIPGHNRPVPSPSLLSRHGCKQSWVSQEAPKVVKQEAERNLCHKFDEPMLFIVLTQIAKRKDSAGTAWLAHHPRIAFVEAGDDAQLKNLAKWGYFWGWLGEDALC